MSNTEIEGPAPALTSAKTSQVDMASLEEFARAYWELVEKRDMVEPTYGPQDTAVHSVFSEDRKDNNFLRLPMHDFLLCSIEIKLEWPH